MMMRALYLLSILGLTEAFVPLQHAKRPASLLATTNQAEVTRQKDGTRWISDEFNTIAERAKSCVVGPKHVLVYDTTLRGTKRATPSAGARAKSRHELTLAFPHLSTHRRHTR